MITQTEVRRHPVWREEAAAPTRSDVPRTVLVRVARVAAVVTVLVVVALVAGLFFLRSALPAD